MLHELHKQFCEIRFFGLFAAARHHLAPLCDGALACGRDLTASPFMLLNLVSLTLLTQIVLWV